MSTARETIIAATQGHGCLGKAANDEPVFVLRAQDKFAPALVEMWASLFLAEYVPGTATEKAQGAMMVAQRMRVWQQTERVKIPD